MVVCFSRKIIGFIHRINGIKTLPINSFVTLGKFPTFWIFVFLISKMEIIILTFYSHFKEEESYILSSWHIEANKIW